MSYQTGIDMTLAGTEGTDWYSESLWHDPTQLDRTVYYIKAATDISLAHNARNSKTSANNTTVIIGVDGEDSTPDSGDEGVIRYRVDGDHHWGPLWAVSSQNPAYSSPFDFASLNYGAYGDAGVSVVGTTGDNGVSQTLANKGSFYHRGSLDTVGDEWHTITVADDDSGFAAEEEFNASDGKMFHFVVNPKTPCVRITRTGDAQFYTTPAKHYFHPKVHDQTTYIDAGTGDIDIEIRDINGNNVFYRIGGGSFTDAGAAAVTLDESDFASGSNTLEYYYAGNAAYTKTRTVVKVDRSTSTDFPSDGETHGDLFWGDASKWAEIAGWFTTDSDFSGWLAQWKTNDFWNDLTYFDDNLGLGRRVHTDASKSAIIARLDGNAETRAGHADSFATYAKKQLMENELCIDPVGFELAWNSSALPSRDYNYRGYYDVVPLFGLAMAYDVIIGQFKSTDATGGVTPVEDHYIRDLLASWVFAVTQYNGDYGPDATAQETGMWDMAKKAAAQAFCIVMPSYSTPYFGTCGLDGSTAVYAGVPFPSTNFPWADLYVHNTAATPGYPNNARAYGLEEDLISAGGDFTNRVLYYEDSLLGRSMFIQSNLLKLHYPSVSQPRFELSLLKAANGTLLGLLDGSGPIMYPTYLCLNERFPTVASISLERVRDETVTGEDINEGFLTMQAFMAAAYSPDYVAVSYPPPSSLGMAASILL